MRQFIKKHVKNASLYDNRDEYIKAAKKLGMGRLTVGEREYLLANAVAADGSIGADKIWNKQAKRVIGCFNVCDSCLSTLKESNDVVTITKPRVGVGSCQICGRGGRVLRGASVDNYGKVASFIAKTSGVYNRGDVVRIIDAPARFSALIGDVGEIGSIDISEDHGVTYEVILPSGMRVPYKFRHNQVEPKDAGGEFDQQVKSDNTEIDDVLDSAIAGGDSLQNEFLANALVEEFMQRQAVISDSWMDSERNIKQADPKPENDLAEYPEQDINRDIREQL